MSVDFERVNMNYFFLFVGFCIFFIKNSLCEDLKFDSQKCSLYRELRNLELTKSDINTRKSETQHIKKIN